MPHTASCYFCIAFLYVIFNAKFLGKTVFPTVSFQWIGIQIDATLILVI